MSRSRAALLLVATACGPREPSVVQHAPAAATVVVPVVDASPPVEATPLPQATPPPLPAGVDGSLSGPDTAQIVAAAADGSALLSIGAWVEGQAPASTVVETNATGRVRSNTRYLAVLDAKHDCLEETVAAPTLDSAGSTSTIAEALAILRTPAAGAEIDHLWSLSQRFGTRDLGAATFGIDEGFVLVEANNQLYVRNAAGTFSQLPVGTSARLTPSPDGTHIAFAQCGSPCGGVYYPAILDTRTRKVRRFLLGNAHGFHWSPDGKTLAFSYDDRPSGLVQATKVCIGRVEGDATRATTVRCYPSIVYSVDISWASPSGRFVALQTVPKKRSEGWAFVVLAMPDGTEVMRTGASPIYPDMDDRGRTAWDDDDPHGFRPRVRVASPAGEESFPDAKSVGFLPDGTLLVIPDDRPTQETAPIHTLAERHCGFFATRQPR